MTLKGIGILEFSELTIGLPISLLKRPRNSSVFRLTTFPTSYLGGLGLPVFLLLSYFLGGSVNSSTTSP